MANKKWEVERVLPEAIRKTELVSVAGDNSPEMDLFRRAFDILPTLGWITADELDRYAGKVFRGRSEDFDRLDWRMAEPEGLGWRTSFEIEIMANWRRDYSSVSLGVQGIYGPASDKAMSVGGSVERTSYSTVGDKEFNRVTFDVSRLVGEELVTLIISCRFGFGIVFDVLVGPKFVTGENGIDPPYDHGKWNIAKEDLRQKFDELNLGIDLDVWARLVESEQPDKLLELLGCVADGSLRSDSWEEMVAKVSQKMG